MLTKFIGRFTSFKKEETKKQVSLEWAPLKATKSEEGICDLAPDEEDTPPMALAPADPKEEEFALSMEPASPGAGGHNAFDLREELRWKLVLISPENRKNALQGLTLFAVTEVPAKAVSEGMDAQAVLSLLAEETLPKAALFIESVLKNSRLVAFAEPTAEEEATGDLSWKRRSCFQVSSETALVGIEHLKVRRVSLHKIFMGSE